MEDIEMDNKKDNEISIILKPMNITAIHKRDVKMEVNRNEKVGAFA